MKKSIKNILGYVLSAAIMLSCLPTYAQAPFDGEGTLENPYQIASTDDLVKLAELTNTEDKTFANKHYILTNDLDMTGVEFDGICEMEIHNEDGSLGYTTSYATFTGTFDGAGHIISNVTVDRSDNTECNNTYAGLFCWMGNGAVIKNLGLVDAKVTSGAKGRSGGFIGRAVGEVTIENCFVRGISLTSPKASNAAPCGAIAAELNKGGTITNCYTIGIVGAYSAASYGTGTAPTIKNFYSTNYIAISSTDINVISKIGTAEVATVEEFIVDSNGTFEVDAYGINNGYPVFAWENERKAEDNPKPDPKPDPKPEPEPDTTETTNEVFANGQGNGTVSAPYQLSTPDDLVKLAELTNTKDTTYSSKNYVIVNDIDMSGVEFDGICECEVSVSENNWSYARFTGTLDGAEHVIRNLTVDRTDNTTGTNTYAALIDWVAEGAVIKNLGLVDMMVKGGLASGRAGGFVGRSVGAIRIENCFVRGLNLNAKSDSGAIAGELNGGTVKNCYSTDISSNVGIGGLWGASSNSPAIENVWSTHHIPGNNAVNFLKISGTTTSQNIETFIADSKGAFKEDIFSKNNGNPVLSWENEMVSEDGTVMITDFAFDNTSGVNSSFTIKNCNTEPKPVAVGIVVYGENNKMLGAKIYDNCELGSGEKITESFTFSKITDAVSVKLYLWNTLSEQKLYQVGGVKFKADE